MYSIQPQNTYPTQQNFEQPEAMELENTPKYQQSTTDITPIKLGNLTSIKQLEPNKPFLIKARITRKSTFNEFEEYSDLETYFDVDIIDKDGNQTEVTFFGDAANFFFSQLEVNKVYLFKDGLVKYHNQRWPEHHKICYENVDLNCIEKVQSLAESLANKINFVKIKDIQNKETHSLVDVVGFVKDIKLSEVKQIIGGKIVVKTKKLVYLYDDSNNLPENTNISLSSNQVVVIKGARISDYSGVKSLTICFGTKVLTDPNEMPADPVIYKLLEWGNNEASEDRINKLTKVDDINKKTIFTIEEIQNILLNNSSTISATITAYISYIDADRSDIVYPACENTEKCARKATQYNTTGEVWYKCETCGIIFRDPICRYNLNVKLSDSTGSMWVSIFDKVGNIITGTDANSINQMKKDSPAKIARVFREALNKEYNFTIQAWNGNRGRLDKIKARVIEVEEIPYSQSSNNLLGSLQNYNNKK